MLDSTNMAVKLAAAVDDGERGIKQQDLTVDTAVDDTDYVFTLTFDTFVITFTINSGPGATTASIAALIRAAIDNDTDNDGPGVLGAFVEEGAGAGAVVEIVGVPPGNIFVAATSDANMTMGAEAYVGVDTAEIEKSTGAIVGEELLVLIGADQDDYDPAGLEEATLLRVQATGAPRSITGIVPYHRTLIIVATANDVTLVHGSGSSAAANQFAFAGAVDRVLTADAAVILVYNTTNSKWHAAS